MSIEDFKGLMDGFDPASLLPELEPALEKLVPLARFVVLAGPVAMLCFGLLYLFASPKEANHYLGYRCYYGMGSVEAWRYTQRLAGVVFTAMGLVLLIAMLLISGGFPRMDTMALLWKAVYCVAWEAGLAAVACLTINIVAAVRFDSKGNERKEKTKRR